MKPVRNVRFILLFLYGTCAEKLNENKFPDDFLFGVGSSAYQIEGAWNTDGKEENIWDIFTHKNSEKIADNSNADVACNSYNNYKDDVKLLKELGVNVYKFSMSWSRIMPNEKINQEGLNYYNNLIDLLVENNIQPMVTLFHWDTPSHIQNLGGWINPLTGDSFLEYARLAFETFGDRVKYWITFNDPLNFCLRSFEDNNFAPNTNNTTGMENYICSYVILKSHASVYQLYKNSFKSSQQGLISISLSTPWCEPGTTSDDDLKASERLFQFCLGQFAQPIYGNGKFPKIMTNIIDENSLSQGYVLSRLRTFSHEEATELQGTFDFFAINFYTSVLVSDTNENSEGSSSFLKDAGVKIWFDEKWNSSALAGLKVTPWGLRKLLKKIKEEYGDIPIFITENGFSDSGTNDDFDRAYYLQVYLNSLLDSIYEDGVKVIGYIFWSLLDSFEWSEGFKIKFGLYDVDFSSTKQTRTPKLSAIAYKEIIQNKRLPTQTTSKP